MSNAKSLMLQKGRPETVELDVCGQVLKVDVRLPSMGLKGRLPELGGGLDERNHPRDMKRMIAATLAMCCYEHGTLNKLFSVEDADEISEAGPHIDELFRICASRLNPDPDALKGKSEATTS